VSSLNYALRALKNVKGVKGLQFTKEEVEDLHRSLDEETQDVFREYDEARRRSWQKAGSIILD
jgi:hypothetical protein